MQVKEDVYRKCVAYVDKRLATIQNYISSNQKALQTETKSSAGDKHETGRAMLQLEMEKAGQQLQVISQMKEILDKIELSNSSKIAHLGSLIYTNIDVYFLSISAGKITADKKEYFAISVSSPIGKLLLGKQENDVVFFNGKEIRIVEIL